MSTNIYLHVSLVEMIRSLITATSLHRSPPHAQIASDVITSTKSKNCHRIKFTRLTASIICDTSDYEVHCTTEDFVNFKYLENHTHGLLFG